MSDKKPITHQINNLEQAYAVADVMIALIKGDYATAYNLLTATKSQSETLANFIIAQNAIMDMLPMESAVQIIVMFGDYATKRYHREVSN